MKDRLSFSLQVGSINSGNQKYLHQHNVNRRQKKYSVINFTLIDTVMLFFIIVVKPSKTSTVCSELAVRRVSFLEASPRSLRCFLMQRDAWPGGAISTELCQAVQNSHFRALLTTPDFLQEDWCTYIMHQVLAEGSMSNRIIPLIHNLSHSQYPQKLRFYYYIDLGRNPDGL